MGHPRQHAKNQTHVCAMFSHTLKILFKIFIFVRKFNKSNRKSLTIISKNPKLNDAYCNIYFFF